MIEVIQPFLAPAIMFSAGGLLCLAQFARLTAIHGLVRTLNRERLAVLRDLQEDPGQRSLLEERAEGLESQTSRVLGHARTVRDALRFLVGGILLMVACSLSIGLSLVLPEAGVLVLFLFVGGLVSIFVGLCLVLRELGVSTELIEFEHENLNRLRREGTLLGTT